MGVRNGITLIGGIYDIVLAAACSMRDPQPYYRAGANKEATDLVGTLRLGQPERGSFVVSVMTSTIPPPMQMHFGPDWLPDDRQTGR